MKLKISPFARLKFGEGKGKGSEGSCDPMSFTLLRSGLWTKLGVNLSGKDYSHQTLRITWMHLPSYIEIVPEIFDPRCLSVFSRSCFFLYKFCLLVDGWPQQVAPKIQRHICEQKFDCVQYIWKSYHRCKVPCKGCSHRKNSPKEGVTRPQSIVFSVHLN